jgi:hypothetical protein
LKLLIQIFIEMILLAILAFVCPTMGDLAAVHRAIVRRDIHSLTGQLVGRKELVSSFGPDGKGPACWALESGGDPMTVGVLMASGVNFLDKRRDLSGKIALECLGRPVTDLDIAQWGLAAEGAKQIVTTIKKKLVETLQEELHSHHALEEELDSYDD